MHIVSSLMHIVPRPRMSNWTCPSKCWKLNLNEQRLCIKSLLEIAVEFTCSWDESTFKYLRIVNILWCEVFQFPINPRSLLCLQEIPVYNCLYELLKQSSLYTFVCLSSLWEYTQAVQRRCDAWGKGNKNQTLESTHIPIWAFEQQRPSDEDLIRAGIPALRPWARSPPTGA